jgi:hypothetical protein
MAMHAFIRKSRTRSKGVLWTLHRRLVGAIETGHAMQSCVGSECYTAFPCMLRRTRVALTQEAHCSQEGIHSC